VGYWALNKVIIPDKHPISTINELLDEQHVLSLQLEAQGYLVRPNVRVGWEGSWSHRDNKLNVRDILIVNQIVRG